MSDKIGIAIVGSGNMASWYAGMIQKKIKNANLVAVFSNTESRAKEFANRYNISYHLDYDELLSRADIDAVIIANVNHLHAEFGIKAAKARKHILVEKPIDISLSRADELIRVCDEFSVKLSVVSQHRFDKKIRQLKEMITQGKLGKIFMGSVSTKWQRTQENYDNPPWKKTFQSAGGGVLIMQAIHNIDILQWLMGSVEFVYGKSGIYTHDIEVEDVAVAMLQFENGALGVIEATTSVQRTIPNRLEIHGDLGSVVIGGNIKTKQRNRMVGRLPWVKGSLTMQLEDFINAIIEDRTPFVNGKEGRKTLAIINAIYESNRIGRPVFLIQGGCVL